MIVTTNIKQTTISKKISLKGVGLHTGKDVTLTFVPSTADIGYVFKRVDLPIVCDADALSNHALELVLKRSNQSGPVVLTPHMGEFRRIAKLDREEVSTESLLQYCQSNKVITVLKGPITQICDGQMVWYNSFGGPVLSRGGSGDMLAGLIGGLLAQNNNEVTESVAQAVVLHGQAAEYLAREEGQVTVQTTQVLDFLSIVLRGD